MQVHVSQYNQRLAVTDTFAAEIVQLRKIDKQLDFGAAIAEMEHFGMLPAPFLAVAVIVFELAMSANSRCRR